jgi:hypothetical protein
MDQDDIEVPRIRQSNMGQKAERHFKARNEDADSDLEIGISVY